MTYTELSSYTINMKSMDQDIDDIVIGAGDVNGRTLKIIFTQEAAAQITDKSKIYLSWYHKEEDIHGLKVFSKQSNKFPVWQIKIPKMPQGNVIATIKIVDNISIVQSSNFIIHVLEDPDFTNNFEDSDDYSVFEETIMNLNVVQEKAQQQLETQYNEFEQIKNDYNSIHQEIEKISEEVKKANEVAQETVEMVNKLAVTVQDF